MENLSLDEAQELADLTDRIVGNLKYIEEHGPDDADLDRLEGTTSSVVDNLKYIEEHRDASQE